MFLQILNNHTNDSCIFLKVDNMINERYFTELTKLVLRRHETSKGHNNAIEMHVSTCGMELNEWGKSSQWTLTDSDLPLCSGTIVLPHNR